MITHHAPKRSGRAGGTAVTSKFYEPRDNLIPVTLGGFFIHSQSVSLPTRKESLLVRNVGDEKHELVVVRTRDAPNRLPMRGDRVDEQEAGKNYGEADDLAPGHQRSLTLSLPPGRYVMFCNLPGHYHKGMHAEITIT